MVCIAFVITITPEKVLFTLKIGLQFCILSITFVTYIQFQRSVLVQINCVRFAYFSYLHRQDWAGDNIKQWFTAIHLFFLNLAQKLGLVS